MRTLSAVINLLHRKHRNLLLFNASLPYVAVQKSLSRKQPIMGELLVRNMAGHSKWQNIKNIKGKNDAIKANLFSRHATMIRRAIIGDSTDPKLNSKLAKALQEARKVNMPRATIDSVIERSKNVSMKTSELELVGPGGCLMLVEVQSDNVQRTVHDVKTVLKKSKLGMFAKENQCRNQFETKGIVRVSGKNDGSKLDAEKAMDDAILADAEDVQEAVDAEGKDILMFTSSLEDYFKMRKWFEESDYVIQDCGLEYIPRSPIEIPDNDLELASDLLNQLQELDDVLKINVNIR